MSTSPDTTGLPILAVAVLALALSGYYLFADFDAARALATTAVAGSDARAFRARPLHLERQGADTGA
jgi:hypothetical protein